MFPISTTHNIKNDIATQGYSRVNVSELPLNDEMAQAWDTLREDYKTLPRDEYLPGNGLYRYRRYDSFYFYPATGDLALLPHSDYFQSRDINQVTGGVIRRFEPLLDRTASNPFLHELIRFDFANFPLADAEMQYHAWEVDVHLIHVIAQPGSEGHPTPEGVHRDGAEFVTVHIAMLDNADGGMVSIYDDDKKHLESFTLQNVLDSYLFNDAILWHGVTPIVSRDGVNPAQRGILTFDYKYRPDLTREG